MVSSVISPGVSPVCVCVCVWSVWIFSFISRFLPQFVDAHLRLIYDPTLNRTERVERMID